MKKYVLLITLALIVAPLVAAGCVSPSSSSPSPSPATSTSTATATVSPRAAVSASPTASPTGAATASPTASQQSYSITLVNYAFQPSSMTIPRGATVRWTNTAQTVHTVTSDTGVWDSGNLNPGQTYSRQFNDAGTFPYHCNYHRSLGMTGTITVQ